MTVTKASEDALVAGRATYSRNMRERRASDKRIGTRLAALIEDAWPKLPGIKPLILPTAVYLAHTVLSWSWSRASSAFGIHIDTVKKIVARIEDEREETAVDVQVHALEVKMVTERIARGVRNDNA